jgi:hypothetical protein
MWTFVAVLIVTGVWIILGAVVHGGREIDHHAPASEAWWWESSDPSTGIVGHQALPPSHPLARLSRRSPRSIG